MAITEQDVQSALRELIDPVTDENYVDSKALKNLKIDGASIALDIVLGYPVIEQRIELVVSTNFRF